MTYIFGILLALVGSLVSIAFWLPRVVNKEKLKEILGPRYPLVYVVYIANGPLLVFLGFFLLFHWG